MLIVRVLWMRLIAFSSEISCFKSLKIGQLMSEKFEFGLRIPTSIMIQLELWFHAMHRIKLE